MKNKNTLDISVYISVRNEAHRIEACLTRLSWAKEVFIFDKESTDNTIEICEKLGAIVKSVPNTNRSENSIKVFKKSGSCKWCLFLTASDLVGEKLRNIISEYINKKEIKAISLPYLTYLFGNYIPINPLSSNSKVILIRRDNILMSGRIHEEIGYLSKNFFKIPLANISDKESCILHLSNENPLEFYNKFPRYLEKEVFSRKGETVRENIILLLKSILKALIFRPSYIFGIRGLLYTTSYLSYVLSRFTVVTANKHKEKNPDLYQSYEDIRNNKIKN